MRVLKKRVLKWCVPNQHSNKTCAERIKPFLLLFKFCGMFANNVTAGRLKRCSWSAYGICVFWIGIFASYTCLLFSFVTNLDHVSFRLMVHLVKHLIGYISLSVDVIAAYSSQNHFIKFFDRLDGYDHEAARVGYKRRDNLWIPWINGLLMVLVNIFLIYAIIYAKATDIALLASVSDSYTMIIFMCSFLEKFLLLYLLLKRFKHLNDKIAPNVLWDEERREPNAIRISDVKMMHRILYDAHIIFNDIYSNPLLLSFASLMMRVVANLSIFQEEEPLTASSYVCPPLMLMLIICIICHHTAKEANNIACVLNQGMTMLVNSGKTMNKINALTYFLHNNVSFDAAGVFTIDLPLFQSIISTITTYFLILI